METLRQLLDRHRALRARVKLRTDAIRSWPKDAQREWRRLLDVDPHAAWLMAECAYQLDAQLLVEGQLELPLAA